LMKRMNNSVGRALAEPDGVVGEGASARMR
jgi:hypothetical protein